MPRLPVDVQRVTPTGGYGQYRPKARRKHWGVDLGGAPGTPVYAPEPLTVVVDLHDGHYASGRDFAGVKLTGYEPDAVLALGDSGVFHVLGHLASAPRKLVYDEGDQVGTIAKDHTHWEVRKPDRKPWPKATRGDDTLDPIGWLSGFRTASSTASPFDIIAHAQEFTDRVRAGIKTTVVRSVVSDALVLVGLAILVSNGTRSRRRRS